MERTEVSTFDGPMHGEAAARAPRLHQNLVEKSPSLNAGALLSNSTRRPYDPQLSEGWFPIGWREVAMRHGIYIPYLTGGYLRVNLKISGPA